ncbi:uncharacterized protein [Blastocystis hominis]|uniref:Tudor domain-containing protein n=1 Tax=Blastocystis hominis TaxID=12968 RepID=D8LWV2_BLAHO|nr:uncharacterized protein [Blastocystis hominis]CBK20291.2 unnamed protein product [Blastocystis hominis]|eukprot:XP_012894339.1 uncharacterized protein [Blastocystis hominis]
MSENVISLRKESGETKDTQKPKEAQSVTTNIPQKVNPNYIEWKVGDRCEALYKEDNKYYPAIVHKIDEFQIDVTVFYIGYNSSAVLDMSQIRKPTSRWDVADRLPEKDIKPGTKCRVIFHGDGNFYDTIIESVNGDDVNIRYTKFDTYDKVRKSDLKMAGKTEDVVSDDLRILPTDDKKTVNLKKRKMYMLQKEKKAKEENEYYKNKQSAWQQFQQRTQKRRKLLVAEGVISDPFKKESIFRTSEGSQRTSGAAPIERTMTPAPKRVKVCRVCVNK